MLSIQPATLRSTLKEFEQAIHDHLEWHANLLRTIVCELPGDPDDVSARAYQLCRFGRWYCERAPVELREQPTFVAIGIEHRQAHEVAATILRDIASGRPGAGSRSTSACVRRWASLNRLRRSTLAATPARVLSMTLAETEELEYVGFWPRVGAALIDTLLVVFITMPLLTAVYGRQYWSSDTFIHGPLDFLINWLLPALAVILFWVYRQATPGKMAIRARIVDEKSGAKPTTGQLIVRYLGYYVAMLPLFAGIIWVAFDARKQGWHDKLAGTVVVRTKQRGPEPVRFDGTR